jgi:pilus assembly protein Flp/PilA
LAFYAAVAYPEGKEVTHSMIQFISTLLNRFRREDEDGQTLVEYGLLLALIAIIVIVALLFLGPIVSQIFQNVGDNLQGT